MEHLPPIRSLDAEYVSEMVGQPIKSYSMSQGAQKGDNVIGKMLSLKVETEEETSLDVVVKSLLPLTGEVDAAAIGTSQFYVALQVFPAEMTYYQQVRPLLQQLTGYSLNIPKMYSAKSDGLNDYIALEDLRPQGYKMADKRKGLTLHEVTKVLAKLAMLHAHSYAVLNQENEVMEELKNSVLNGHVWGRKIADLDQEVFFNKLVEKMQEVMREIGQADTAAKMQRFTDISYKLLLGLWEKRGTSPKYFQVILHGDLWTNNVLFKYARDGETVEDLTFIDFQQCRFGTIYEDLLYFIFTSTTADFRKTNLRTCLQSYFKAFEKALSSLENPAPLPTGFTDEELIATFYENIEYGFSYDLVAIPFQLGGDAGPPQDNVGGPPQQPDQLADGPPSALAMALMMCEVMKQGTISSPIALQRLKELCNEMVKLNILS